MPTEMSSSHAASSDRPSDLAVRPTVLERIRQVVDTLIATRAPGEFAEPMRLAELLHGRLVARIACCRDAVISSRLAGLEDDQLASLRTLAPAPEHLVEQLAPELDTATLLAILDAAMPAPVATASDLDGRKLGLNEAALDALSSSAVLDRFDCRCRMHCARALGDYLQAMAVTDAVRRAAQRSLALEDPDRRTEPSVPRDAGEALLLKALRKGDHDGAIRILAAAALVPVAAIETAITLRSRRGMVSLAWKAGYSMHAAILMQSQLAGIPPQSVLMAAADGSCPLSRNELLWQIGFLASRLG